MFNSNIFKIRYLVALILLVVLVAAVGNAAALTVNDANQNVVAGTASYNADDATVTYTIAANGSVTARLTFSTDAYDKVWASFDGGTTYATCTIVGASPSSTWDCTMTRAQAAAAPSIDIVATTDN